MRSKFIFTHGLLNDAASSSDIVASEMIIQSIEKMWKEAISG